MQTFVSLVDFSKLALFFDLSLQFVILRLLISVIHYYMFVHYYYYYYSMEQSPSWEANQ